MTLPAMKPTLTLPTMIAHLGIFDGGEHAECPHCGADGRWIHRFLCDDGTMRGAMSGCVQLFPQSNKGESKLVQEAFKRLAATKETNPPKRLAGWWSKMVQASEDLALGRHDLEAWRKAVWAAESQRQEWLQKNGYGRARR